MLLQATAMISIRSLDVQIIDILCGFVLIGPTGALIRFLLEFVAEPDEPDVLGVYFRAFISLSSTFGMQRQITQL